jgi:hypothetical protein
LNSLEVAHLLWATAWPHLATADNVTHVVPSPTTT